MTNQFMQVRVKQRKVCATNILTANCSVVPRKYVAESADLDKHNNHERASKQASKVQLIFNTVIIPHTLPDKIVHWVEEVENVE